MQENPIIEDKILANTDVLYFTFSGKLSESDARNAEQSWRKFLSEQSTKYCHVWNCTEMTGYEPMARIIWQKAMKELKGEIDEIWLISDSTLIVAGAKIMSLFTSFDIHAVQSESEIITNLESRVSAG